MYKIISFESESQETLQNTIVGWIEDDKQYKSFRISQNNEIEYADVFLKEEFRNYEHFVGVQSKFDPYQFFLAEPIPLLDLTYESVLEEKAAFERKK